MDLFTRASNDGSRRGELGSMFPKVSAAAGKRDAQAVDQLRTANVTKLAKATLYQVAPNGWRVSGERRAEGDERVRCTRMLGRG